MAADVKPKRRKARKKSKTKMRMKAKMKAMMKTIEVLPMKKPRTSKTKTKAKAMASEVASIRSGVVETPDAGNTDARLEDVLRANGEEHLYDQIMHLADHVEDDPPVIFGWQSVEDFVEAMEVARGPPALPADPLGLPPPPAVVTVQEFKEAVLAYATVPGAEPRLDTNRLWFGKSESSSFKVQHTVTSAGTTTRCYSA